MEIKVEWDDIKPGKWKTRDGRQAVVLEVFEGKAYGRVKYHEEDGGDWHGYRWYYGGRYLSYENAQSPADLIAPWEEPKPRLRVWREKHSGEIRMLEEMPEGRKFTDSIYLDVEWQPVPELDALFERSEG